MTRLAASAVEAPREPGNSASPRDETATAPPRMETGPVKELAVLSVRVPGPVLVRPPGPAREPEPESV